MGKRLSGQGQMLRRAEVLGRVGFSVKRGADWEADAETKGRGGMESVEVVEGAEEKEVGCGGGVR